MKISKIPHEELGRLTDPKGSYCFPACDKHCPEYETCFERKMYERLQWFEDRHFADNK